MNIEYKKIVKIDELAHLIPTKAGATFSQLWQIFYYTRLFKYVSYKHYQQIKAAFKKIATYRNLKELCFLGYLKSPRHEVYCATDKVLPILKAAGYAIELLPVETEGTGNINELNNTDVFVRLTKLEHFNTLLYPKFDYIIPDALLVQLDKQNACYKLTFIEVEAKKPDWANYIEKKRGNYMRLSQDIVVYNKWKKYCTKLALPVPDIKDFCFTVSFYGSIQKDFGQHFNFYNV
jgi:hypothetical protein